MSVMTVYMPWRLILGQQVLIIDLNAVIVKMSSIHLLSKTKSSKIRLKVRILKPIGAKHLRNWIKNRKLCTLRMAQLRTTDNY